MIELIVFSLLFSLTLHAAAVIIDALNEILTNEEVRNKIENQKAESDHCFKCKFKYDLFVLEYR